MFARSLFVPTTIALVACCGVSHAQVAPVQPFYAVVNGDAATLRSAPTSNAYSVAAVPTNSIIIVDGEEITLERFTFRVASADARRLLALHVSVAASE